MRILFRQGARLVLGPLGLYERGQRLEVEGKEVLVVNVDHDGAGVALTVEFLEGQAEAEGKDLAWALERYANSRTCDPPMTEGSARPANMITARIFGNRRRAGLDETDPREQRIAF